jgi:hypothetical protein
MLLEPKHVIWLFCFMTWHSTWPLGWAQRKTSLLTPMFSPIAAVQGEFEEVTRGIQGLFWRFLFRVPAGD